MPTVGVFVALFDDFGRILCVKRNYGPRNWTTPGGRLEAGESPLEAVRREVYEETGYHVVPGELIGVYSAPFRDDLVLFFSGKIASRGTWQPDDEISARAFFERSALPDMHARTRARIDDAFQGRRGMVRIFEPEP